MRQSQAGPRVTASVAILAAIVGSALAGLHAGGVSAGQATDIVLSTNNVAPRQAFDALFTCTPREPIQVIFQGAAPIISCGEAGLARAPLTAPDEPGEYEVFVRVPGVDLSAQVVVVAPGQPTLVSSGAFSPNVPVSFAITGCVDRRGSAVVGEFDGQQTTEACRIDENDQTSAVFDFPGPGEPGIYPVTVTLNEPEVVLDGAVYVAGETASPGPELPVSGPLDSIMIQLVAAAAAVGVGAVFIAWARRRRTTIWTR